MKAVVVGGSGFIGSHLVDLLLSDRWQVTVCDRVPERFRRPLPAVEYVLGEMDDKDSLLSCLTGADVVFHLASTTIPQSSNRSPALDVESNLTTSIRFLEMCLESRVGKVVFLSSGGTVYGIPASVPVSEDCPTNPLCSYGIVKLAIEKYLYLFSQMHGLSYTVLRPSNPYGRRQDPLGSQGAAAVFLGHVARGLPIEIWGDGKVVRDYFHVSDMARACLLAATTEDTHRVFNIGSGQGTSLNDLVSLIETTVERPVGVVRLPTRPFDVPTIILNTRRALTSIGWAPEVSLKDGILDTWLWVREHVGERRKQSV